MLQQVPEGFDILIIIGYIGVIHVDPVSHAVGQLFPFPGIFHDRLPAGFIIFRNGYLFPYIFLRNFQFLFNGKLNGKSVCIPAGLAVNPETFLCFVTAENILNGP
ncbi:hypothetical protein ES708_16535 [subsurface metagenome]